MSATEGVDAAVPEAPEVAVEEEVDVLGQPAPPPQMTDAPQQPPAEPPKVVKPPVDLVAPSEETKVFVGGLSWDTTDISLKTHFEKFGTVVHVEIMKDRYTLKSRGFGFVTFKFRADADKACAAGSHAIDGRNAEAKLAIPPERMPDPMSARLFVGRLPHDLSSEELRAYFEQFGTLGDAHTVVSRETGLSRGFGFVTFEDPKNAEEVLRQGQLGQIIIKGKECDVKKAEARAPRGPPGYGGGGGRYRDAPYDPRDRSYRDYGGYGGGRGYDRGPDRFGYGRDPYGGPPPRDMYWRGGGGGGGGGYGGGGRGYGGGGRGYGDMPPRGPRTFANRAGDWNCRCGEHNFATRDACRRCNSPKTQGTVIDPSMAGQPIQRRVGGAGGGGGGAYGYGASTGAAQPQYAAAPVEGSMYYSQPQQQQQAATGYSAAATSYNSYGAAPAAGGGVYGSAAGGAAGTGGAAYGGTTGAAYGGTYQGW